MPSWVALESSASPQRGTPAVELGLRADSAQLLPDQVKQFWILRFLASEPVTIFGDITRGPQARKGAFHVVDMWLEDSCMMISWDTLQLMCDVAQIATAKEVAREELPQLKHVSADRRLHLRPVMDPPDSVQIRYAVRNKPRHGDRSPDLWYVCMSESASSEDNVDSLVPPMPLSILRYEDEQAKFSTQPVPESSTHRSALSSVARGSRSNAEPHSLYVRRLYGERRGAPL